MKKIAFLALLLAATAVAQNPPAAKPSAKPGLIGSDAPKPAAPEPITGPETPERTIERFFLYLQRKEVEQAYSQLTRGTKIAQRPDDVRMLQSKTTEALAAFGAVGGYEVVANKKVGTRLMSYTVISLGKEFPLRWRFYFYNATDVWKLIDLRVDDRLAAMFDETEEARAASRAAVSAAAPRSRLADALRFIRFSHTVFALPFALGAMLVAAGGLPAAKMIGLILLAMIFARTAAMTFNRLADWEMDRRNPRTEARHRLLPKPAAIGLLVASTAAFAGTTWFINPLCFSLSPVALAIVFFYSLTKRFTHGAQFFLGLALSVSPMGAWFAVTGAWAWTPCFLALAVLLWVAGFDTIYATQDHDFDRAEGLHSIVVALGIPRALVLARTLHLAAFAALAAFGWMAGLRLPYWLGLALIAGALIYEHRSAAQLDSVAINRAFFLSNAFVGAVFVAAIATDVFTR